MNPYQKANAELEKMKSFLSPFGPTPAPAERLVRIASEYEERCARAAVYFQRNLFWVLSLPEADLEKLEAQIEFERNEEREGLERYLQEIDKMSRSLNAGERLTLTRFLNGELRS